MNWLWSFAGSIFVLAWGNAMLGANTRRGMAVRAGRTHSVTGEPLTDFPARQRIIGWALVGVGATAFVTLMVLWVAGLDLPY